ncbi:ATP-grasp domain-containing protein [Enterovibrio sp. ZSDZ35]|uniref:ATP-grasp domain-containing protein n=1 Tax=Enterovibrio qingdaonensis TaxID=2899818 RepID=A0ABT5QTQ9_9GAMM|nr:ATP-grasp domain-containing protein [Enterovibrio sp. ZSDZ35]MDD1783974.1 ATP-grasp domain-containing protein [Enterovibrio sp. ZSDZ35]
MVAALFNPEQIDWIKERVKIAVICGGEKGCSDNYVYENLSPRSTKTYRYVAEDIVSTLQHEGFASVEVLEENMHLPQQLKSSTIDVAFLNSGGLQGYDSMCHLPSMMEMLGVPYIGHTPMTAGLLDNKLMLKSELSSLGIPTAPFITLEPGKSVLDASCQRALNYIDQEFGEGYIVKPVVGRASIHVYPVFHRSELQEIVERVHRATNNVVLIEPYLSGAEFVAAVSGRVLYRAGQLEESDKPFVFSIFERVLDDGEHIFTSMDVRPITVDRMKPVVDVSLKKDIEDIVVRIFRAFNLQTLIRVDLRMDNKGRLFVLEANPKPDLKMPRGDEINLVTAGLDEEGMKYEELLQSLIFNRLQYLYRHRPSTLSHCLNHSLFNVTNRGVSR